MEFLIRVWHAYPALLDFALYLMVLTAAARVGLAKSFPSHEGRILAVAIGIFLAASLTIAQRRLGFSLERMGPVAAFLLCGVVFIAAYRFMRHAEAPLPLTIVMSALVALALARAVMPGAAAHFIRENPLLFLVLSLGVAYWAWHSSQGYLDKIASKRPGRLLGKHHVLPDETFLRKEKRYADRKLRSASRQQLHGTKDLGRGLETAADLAAKSDVARDSRTRLMGLLDDALTKANQNHKYSKELLKSDEALRRVDADWLKRAHGFNLNDLTPEQRALLRKSLQEERRRLKTEAFLERLQVDADAHLQAVTEFVRKARNSLAHGAAVGAAGWLARAQAEREEAVELEKSMLEWEDRLMRLVKRQLHEFRKAA